MRTFRSKLIDDKFKNPVLVGKKALFLACSYYVPAKNGKARARLSTMHKVSAIANTIQVLKVNV